MTHNEITDQAKTAAASAVASLKETGREALSDVRLRAGAAASRATEAARAEALSRGETAKDTLAEQAERLARTLRGAVEGGDGSVQARLMGAVADSVDDLTGSLRNRSVQDLLADAESFARRNPGAFVAAAALAGFALARFARASAPTPAYDPSLPAVSQGYATMPSPAGATYGSARPSGSGHAGSSGMGYGAQVSTHSRTTHDEGLSSVDALPDADADDFAGSTPDRDAVAETEARP